MWKKLQQYIFAYQLRHMPKPPSKWLEWGQIRNILLLFESDYIERNDEIKQLRDRLLLEDKDVTIWGYVDKADITTLVLPQSRVVGPKSFTLFGTPREALLNDLQKREYDLLLDLTQHPSLPLQYLALYSRAQMKVGAHLLDGIHDFMIQMPPQESPVPLFEQLKHFLNSIHTND